MTPGSTGYFLPKCKLMRTLLIQPCKNAQQEYKLCRRNKMDKISLPIDNWFTTNYRGEKRESLRSVSRYVGLARRLEDISTTAKCKVADIVIWTPCWDIKEYRLCGCKRNITGSQVQVYRWCCLNVLMIYLKEGVGKLQSTLWMCATKWIDSERLVCCFVSLAFRTYHLNKSTEWNLHKAAIHKCVILMHKK